MENRYYKYSETGEYHKLHNAENQDEVYIETNAVTAFVAVADGVSACKNSKKGAQIACRAAAGIMLGETDYIFSCSAEKAATLLLNYIRKKIGEFAKSVGQDEKSFASTLSFACISEKHKKIMTFCLGDSCIFTVSNGVMTALEMSELYENNQCCVTMTEGAQKQIKINILDKDAQDALMLCSDGACKCMYKGSRPDDVIAEAIMNGDNEKIEEFFGGKTKNDDCSFLICRV